ncbi:DUF6942 family protein [Microbulbifer yueqingensis]|uniref:Uracil DNA glycosylase superfamily protein n=1 Tax=Microbulbifer yueqingensis TaxID=658219 RepID=A0A1G9DPP6_9GAMM|nr:hypothetical protein [Microbulbifer yueqingensis]SDK65836.1 hypothetical protein SAMN05216212_2904 [Microbulbifer yueqingensis]
MTKAASEQVTSVGYLGAARPRLALYLPHRPNGLAQLARAPSSQELVAANSNHWRKIVTLLSKVTSPDADDWRSFRDEELFLQTALCFAPALSHTALWHWIGGKDNLKRFSTLNHHAQPLPDCPTVSIDPDRHLLLTPYPDYRQLSNSVVENIRTALGQHGFYRQ